MSKKIFIGIDNGVTGTIGITGLICDFILTPTFSEQSYTKKKGNITRIDTPATLGYLFNKVLDTGGANLSPEQVIVGMERPMVNPGRFTATTSALRALEATLITIERLGFAYVYLDSKEWQKKLLPSGITGTDLKKASLDIGNRLFPQFKENKSKDRDGLLIAEYMRQKYGS